MEQRVITLFHESIEAKMQAGEQLAPLIAHSSELMVESLLHEGKILTCGNGASAALAQTFTSALLNRFEHERPSLPALNIGADAITQSAIAQDHTYNEIYAKQIRALGNPGDILVLINAAGSPGNLLQAISAAHDRDIPVIALTGRDSNDIVSLLDNRDIELRAPDAPYARIHEVHLLTLFCLCDLIEQQLFGSHE
ncbi:SIS domain-containing protein [Gilvimarinus sp. DA14]|uniref:SIS domain-containing protein n=1 Tax=Gilvimarinus sp. DA14 TaxID=2956798 RepID=UPI0020B77795|nr:SIS domain-containing protein [Gilvimarinus sp. DA14]UTF59635.1 SIS domain-containing protein [Gilvimarinus sp. DA14]